MFRVPDSDDLPSTPPRDQLSFFTHKSTTPSNEPPTYLTNVSTTPPGPPPRSVYGSSFNGGTFPHGRTPLKGFALPQSSPPQEEDEDAEGEDDDMMAHSFAPQGHGTIGSSMFGSTMNSPRGLKRSRNGRVQPRHESDMPAIARSLAKQSGSARLDEPDDFVIRTEDIVAGLDAKAQKQPLAELDGALASGSAQLTTLWSEFAQPSTLEGSVGPAGKDAIAQASYVASFLLQTHHPHGEKPTQINTVTRFQRGGQGQRAPTSAIPIPKALLNWINAHHNPYPDDYDAIHLTQPAPSSNESFWDVVYSSALRGKFDRLVRLLRDAHFEHAVTALDDGAGQPGYHGRQLENTQAVVAHCINLLESCPAMKYDDWDIKGSDWALFRQRIRQAVSELEEFAEGEDDDRDAHGNAFAQSSRSDMRQTMSFSTASRRAESKIPWTIYENLRALYGQMLGSTDEIVLVSQDWVEACVYLTVWWDGEDITDPSASVSRSNLRRSTAAGQRTREVDVAPGAAYRNRLADAHAEVTTDPEDSVFQVDTMNPVLVALASAMEDNVEGVTALLRTWSLPVATSIVEIAALGGWLPQGRPRSKGLMQQGFSSEDLMVLSHGPSSQKPAGEMERDAILLEYADSLAEKNSFQSPSEAGTREGWELAVAVLGRLDDAAAAQRRIGGLLEGIDLKDDVRVDKVLGLCSNLGLTEQARTISERYADSLTESPQAYGTALIFYARAHAATKLKDTLSLLTSLSLIQSAAVPSVSELDQQLASLLSKDRPGFVRLARSDPKAATLLSSNFSGYATLRKFYNLRDQDVASNANHTQHLRPLERKREAAKALMAVIDSASDCIRGGLFDPEVESAIPADALLILLGETLPLLSTERRIFSKADVYALLRIVEDFSTAPARIRERAEDLFQASANSYRGVNTDSLKKSRSDLSSGTGSSYDMLASSVMALSQNNSKAGAQVSRGWDWRKGLDGAGGASVGSNEVLVVLRLALSQEIAKSMSGVY
ncbi:hypothetical protein Q7P37_004558 [Cladosporium fusiforme]